MPIEGFNFENFAKNLAGQAKQVVPPHLSEEEKAFVVNIIYKFCYLSGEALSNDENIKLTGSQAMLITQFIGEWTFHKSIDLINGHIDSQFREAILQKVAFTVFEIAKQATINNIAQEQMIPLVEHHVTTCFKEAIDDLAQKGALNEGEAQDVLSQSNIDAMAQNQAQQEATGAQMSDNKILKLASVALVLKQMPQEKITNILKKFDVKEAEVLIQYLKMPDLENKLDKNITARCLKEIKGVLPEPVVLSPSRIFNRLQKIVKNSDKQIISIIINNERQLVKNLINTFDTDEMPVSTHVANVICSHLEEKMSQSR